MTGARARRRAGSPPTTAALLIWAALRMPAIERAYAAYPRAPDLGALHRWARAAALLAGHERDVERA